MYAVYAKPVMTQRSKHTRLCAEKRPRLLGAQMASERRTAKRNQQENKHEVVTPLPAWKPDETITRQ